MSLQSIESAIEQSPVTKSIVDDANALLEKVIQAQVGLPPGVTDPVLVKIEGAIQAVILHGGGTPATAAVREHGTAVVTASTPTPPASTSP